MHRREFLGKIAKSRSVVSSTQNTVLHWQNAFVPKSVTFIDAGFDGL